MFVRLPCIALKSFTGFILESMKHEGVELTGKEADFMETLRWHLKVWTELIETV